MNIKNRRQQLVIFYWLAVVAPFIAAVLSGMGGREVDPVMKAIGRIESAVIFMGCWIIAAIITTRIDRLPK